METHLTRLNRLPADEPNGAKCRAASKIMTNLDAGRATRRHFAGLLASIALLPWTGRTAAADGSGPGREFGSSPAKTYPLFDEATASVIPKDGFQSRIALKDSIVKLIEHGVIDREKFLALYATGKSLPGEFSAILDKPSDRKIVLTMSNAPYYVNLLWPVGLATQMAANAGSPLNGDSLFGFASTGGWTLGRKANGGAYFNKFPIVKLTKKQEALVVQIAKLTFRPCCNNSTFFQDCNHGSALLGVLELGASQGLSEQDLFKEALAYNSFWFPDYYIATALYFRAVRNTAWHDVNPATIMGSEFSAGGPWQQNVLVKLNSIPNLFPPPQGGANCGT